MFCAGVGSRIDDAISSVCILGPSAFQSQAGFNSMMIWVIDIIVNLGKRKEMTAASGQEGGQGHSQGEGRTKTTFLLLALIYERPSGNSLCYSTPGPELLRIISPPFYDHLFNMVSVLRVK